MIGCDTVAGGDEGNRTLDPLLAGQVLSQLSYTPIRVAGMTPRPPALCLSVAFGFIVLARLVPCVILCAQNQSEILPAGHKSDRRPSLPPLGLKGSLAILKNCTARAVEAVCTELLVNWFELFLNTEDSLRILPDSP